MSLGVRGKLFLSSLAVVVIVVATSAVYLETRLRNGLENRIEAELLRHAMTAGAMLERESGRSIESIDGLADQLGRAMSARITYIAHDGSVLGDSEVELDGVLTLENHANRPEVQAAQTGGSGSSRRYSTTLQTHMLYVAVPFGDEVEGGVVRASKPLADVDQAVSQLRKLVLVAGLIGIVVALLMTGIAAHVLSRTLRHLVRSTRKMAEAGGTHRISVSSADELGSLAHSINRMSEEMEQLVADLAHERDRFGAVLEGMKEAVIALDSNQRITVVNQSAQTLLGRSEPLVGQLLSDILRAPPIRDLLTDLRNGRGTSIEIELGDTENRIIEVHSQPSKASEGAVLVMRDVTRIRQLESMRRDFIANASHELRTPVSLIRANAETLLDGALEDVSKRRQFVEAQLRGAERLSQLITDLLDLSQIESGKIPLNIQPEPVNPALNRAADVLRQRADEKRLSIEVLPDCQHHVLADAHSLEQILFNFVDNAVKYTDEGGHITLRSVHSGETIRIEVQDDGPGISPQHRERLFERFYRVDPGRSREMGGTGLGLAIVKHLAVAMGGKVGESPATPRGSVFWLELPASLEQSDG